MKHKSTRKISVNSVKVQNRRIILEEILENKGLSRTEMAKKLGISNATVGTIVDEFIQQDLIHEEKDLSSSVGRRPSIVKMNENHGVSLSINLNTINFSFAVLDILNSIKIYVEYSYDSAKSFRNNLELFLDQCQEKLELHDYVNRLLGVGVCIPGNYIKSSDTVVCKGMPQFKGIKLRELIESYFNEDIVIDNDVNFVSLADIKNIEHYYNKSIVFLYLGRGIGGAVTLEGRLYKGSSEFAGEMGQMLMNSKDTFESLVSWSRFKEEVCKHYAIQPEDDYREVLMEKYESQDVFLTEKLEEVTDYIGQALNNIIWIVNPNTVVISGYYNMFGQPLLDAIIKKATVNALPELIQNLEMFFSSNLDRSAALGAGYAVRDRWIRNVTLNS